MCCLRRGIPLCTHHPERDLEKQKIRGRREGKLVQWGKVSLRRENGAKMKQHDKVGRAFISPQNTTLYSKVLSHEKESDECIKAARRGAVSIHLRTNLWEDNNSFVPPRHCCRTENGNQE